MKSQQHEKYYYTRTKNVVPSETGPELFLFAGIVKELEQPLGDSIRKKTTSIVSEMIEEPFHTCSAIYKELPNETVLFEISYNECLELERVAEVDLQSFFLFRVQ